MTEQQIHVAIAQFLDVALPVGAWHTALDSSSKSSAVAGAKLKARGGKKGTPDHLILWDRRTVFLEIKTPKGRLSDEQKCVSDAIWKAGGWWYCVRSVDGTEAALRAANFPLRATCGVSGAVFVA